MKKDDLLALARLRRCSQFEGYAAVGDFHDGIYDCDHVDASGTLAIWAVIA